MKFDFLSLRPDAFGLDLSDLSIKILKLKKTRKGFFPVSYGNFPIPEGLVEQGEIKDEPKLAEVLIDACKKVQGKKLQTSYVVASLPEEKAFLSIVQLPPMNAEDIQGAVQFELENYIPYSPDTVYTDTVVVPSIQNHIDHTDVLLAALPKTTVDSYLSLFQKAHLVAQVFEIESLASARAVIQNGIAPFPTLVIDFGASRTSFIVYAGYSVRFTASIIASSMQLTKAVSKAMRVDEKKAEALKFAYGISKPQDPEGKQVFEALVPLLVDLTEQVKKYVDYYEAHAPHQHLTAQDTNIKKILLTGGGSNLRGLKEFLEAELKTEVELGNPWVNALPQPFYRLPPFPLEDALKYTTVIGLALRGITILHD